MKLLYNKTMGKIKKNRKKLEKKLNVKIKINKDKVTFSGDELDCFEAEKVIKAIDRNFAIDEALLLTREDHILEDIPIKRFTTRKDLSKVKGRIIGKDAKTIQTVNDLADCKITLHHNTVSLLGPAEKMKDTMTAIKKLIKGSDPSKVYAYLERMRREGFGPEDIGMKESFRKRIDGNYKSEEQKLDEWYNSEDYDPENEEIKKILELVDIKDKNILLIDNYGSFYLSSKLKEYANSVTVINESKEIIKYCQDKDANIEFNYESYEDTKLSDKNFDTVIIAWIGLHHRDDFEHVLEEAARILKDKGSLLVEESNPDSEYIEILDKIAPKSEEYQEKIKERRQELNEAIKERFEIEKDELTTYYYFKSKEKLKEYLKNEIELEGGEEFTQEIEDRLDEYLEEKAENIEKDEEVLKVGEKSLLFVGKKK